MFRIPQKWITVAQYIFATYIFDRIFAPSKYTARRHEIKWKLSGENASNVVRLEIFVYDRDNNMKQMLYTEQLNNVLNLNTAEHWTNKGFYSFTWTFETFSKYMHCIYITHVCFGYFRSRNAKYSIIPSLVTAIRSSMHGESYAYFVLWYVTLCEWVILPVNFPSSLWATVRSIRKRFIRRSELLNMAYVSVFHVSLHIEARERDRGREQRWKTKSNVYLLQTKNWYLASHISIVGTVTVEQQLNCIQMKHFQNSLPPKLSRIASLLSQTPMSSKIYGNICGKLTVNSFIFCKRRIRRTELNRIHPLCAT